MKLGTVLKLFIVLLITTTGVFAQQNIGIGTTNPDSSAILDLSSTNKGLLLPRMTKAQRNTIATPKAGLTIFQTDSAPGIYIYDGSKWLIQLMGATSNSEAIAMSQTFNYSGGVQTFTVPPGITSIDFELYGAQGGPGLYTNMVFDIGGNGGKTTGTISVTPNQIIYIYIGGKPTTTHHSYTGGYNGGGYNYNTTFGTSGVFSTSGGGGGATDIRIGGTNLSNRIAVAGGGSGTSLYVQTGRNATGGVGGGTTGGVGSIISGYPTNIGTPTGGSQNAGGIGIGGNNGTLGQGGHSVNNFPSGGAGGGGYYGGASSNDAPSTGGSGYAAPSVQNAVLTSGQNGGNGYAIIKWNDPPKIMITPENPANTLSPYANSTTNGILKSTDWNTFNSKFTLPNLSTGSLLFSNGTSIAENNEALFWDNINYRLGVGTSTPNRRLTVNSTNSGFGSDDWIAGSFGGATGDRVVLGLLNGRATIGAHNNLLNAWADLILQNGGGKVGINTPTPANTLSVNGTTQTTNLIVTSGATSGYVLTSDASGNANWAATQANKTLAAVGGFKVYTSNLNGYTDWIAGSFGGNTNSTGDRVVMGSANGKATIAGHNAAENAWRDLILSPETGSNVGIGTITPAYKLTVNGTTATTNLVIASGAGAGKYLASDASGNASWTSFTNASTTNTGLLTNTDWNTFNNKQNALSNANTTTNGILTSADWNTFNNKQNALSNANTTTNGILTSTDWNTFNNKASAASVASKAETATSISTTGPLSGGGDLSANRTLSIAQANTTTDGYLSSTDWNTFNNKQNTLSNANGTTNGILTSADWNTFNNKQNTLSNANGTTNGILTSVDWNTFNGKASAASVATKADATITINTSGPLSGGGDLSANRTFSIMQANTTTDGYLSSTDWNTFNNKQNTLSNANGTTNGILTSADWNTFNGKASAASVATKADATITINTSGPLSGGGDLSANRTFSITQANTTTDGYLSSTDWNTFNNKQNTLSNANSTTNGFLTSTDWNTFNNKASAAIVVSKADTSTTISTTGPLSGGGNLSANRTLSITQATTTTDGYLSSTDWNTFNNKQNALSNANTTTSGILTSTDWNTFNNKFSLPTLTSGSILFSNGTTLTQNNAQFFWDNTNTRLGIGTNAPTKKLEINGTGGLLVSSTNNGSGTSDWVSGNFGAASGDRIVMGLLFGKATIGAHNNALNAWATLYLQQGGNIVIGADNIAATEKLVVEGNVKATGSVKQTVYSQAISVGANNANSITWNHNLGYQPVIMISLEGSSFAHFCTFAYVHNDNNTLTINLVNNNTSSGANVTVRWIVVN